MTAHTNKYGIVKLTEKKLKEICLTIMLNYTKFTEIDLFWCFLGLTDIYFTNDDLSFYYEIEKLYTSEINDFATSSVMSNAFDHDSNKTENNLDHKLHENFKILIEEYYDDLLSQDQIQARIENVISLSRSTPKYDKCSVLKFMIQDYRYFKNSIYVNKIEPLGLKFEQNEQSKADNDTNTEFKSDSAIITLNENQNNLHDWASLQADYI